MADGTNEWAVTYDRRARFSDCDAQGIVFNPNYLVYWDDTLTDWFDAIGLAWEDFVERGHEMVLARSEVDYRGSARLGDTVRTGLRLGRVGRTSLGFELRSWRPHDGSVFVEGTLVQVVVDAETFRPTPVPEWLVELAAAAQADPPDRA